MGATNFLENEWIEKFNGWVQGSIMGGLFALLFWIYSESTLPSDANCAWLASPGTDVLAFIGAGLCIWRSRVHNDFWVGCFGACVVVIHLCQVASAKSLF